MDLEQKCQRPGYWRIEGFEVVRTPSWEWVVVSGNGLLVRCHTLREAREWIADHLEQQRPDQHRS
jgi:hypothetical protein